MKRLRRTWAAGGLLALASAGAMAGTATVTFVHPENYMDMPRFERDRQDVLKEVADHFIKTAAKLPAGQDLKVEVLDLDLAGRIYPSFRYATDIRILGTGADWPHMHIRYTLTENGQVLQSGEERLANMAYEQRLNRYFSSDPLRYEKQMIDDWFRERTHFAAR